MAKFIKKLAVVDAEQYFPDSEIQGIQHDDIGVFFVEWDGPISVHPTDWIVTYSDGRKELYSDVVFKEIYEPI